MKLKLATAALTALAIITAAPASAAKIWNEPNGCSAKDHNTQKQLPCSAIHLTGKIELNDFQTFYKLVKQNHIETAVVILDSEGGALMSALLMGLEINQRGFNTFVPKDAYCASACASMWLAGAKRFVTESSHVGFHQPFFTDKRGRKHVAVDGIAIEKDYYARIGIPKPAADFFVAAGPDDIYWMNKALAEGFGIDAETIKEPEAKTAESVPAHPMPDLLSPKPLDDCSGSIMRLSKQCIDQMHNGKL
jgi:hypothetical protein